ncbi:MAG: hypothetical protein IKM87_03790 [Clostridia bacterium]|jgi:hypothetical protein|nr:hypothetical protein [Clostridia bacterium]
MDKYLYIFKLRRPRTQTFQGIQIGTLEASCQGDAEDMLDLLMGKYGYGGEITRLDGKNSKWFIDDAGRTIAV